MSTVSLEERVEALETQYAQLVEMVRNRPATDTWRSVVGMFADDPEIQELHKETQRIRDADRTAAREERGEA